MLLLLLGAIMLLPLLLSYIMLFPGTVVFPEAPAVLP